MHRCAQPPSRVPERRQHRRRLAAAALAAAVMLAACGGDDDATADADAIISDVDLVPTTEASPAAPSDRPNVDVPGADPTELVITDLIEGAGRAAQVGDIIIADYIGVRSTDGVEFDNSYDRGAPIDVQLGANRVIAGWEQGLIGVRAGTRRQLDIPAELAYQDRGAGEIIRPGDGISFVLDVRAVIPPVDPQDAPLDLGLRPTEGLEAVSVEDLEVGEGEALRLGETAIIHALLIRGDTLVILYDTWELGDPVQITMQPDAAIDGLIEGLEGMRVGGMRKISIPPDAAFGLAGNPDIGLPEDTDLIVVARLYGRY